MKEKSQFSLSITPRKRKNISVDFEILFNAVATPALIVDPNSHQITLANHTILQLTGYTLAEILDLDIRTLVSDWPDDLLISDKSKTAQPIRLNLNFSCRNHSTIDLTLTSIANLEAGKGVILTFDASPLDPHLVKSIIQGQFWKYLFRVVNTIESEDMAFAIQEILESGCLLTSSSAAMMYTASDQEPEFRRTASFGDSDWLPARVTSQDIKNIRTPRLWLSGKRPLSFLEQIAKVNEISYLACVPIGPPTAIVGVLILADKRSDPSKALIEISSIIAALINLLILKQSYLTVIEGLNHKITDTVLREEILLRNVKEGVIILNQTMDIQELNSSAEQILGYSNQEASGHPVKDVFADTDILLDALVAVNSGSSAYETRNFYLYRRSGQSFMARLYILPLVQDGHPNGAIILINDLSEEDTIRKQTRQLEERAILGEIASVFAHEVRNPVNNISTGLELLSLTIDSKDPNLETISRLRKDCDRLAELMMSILAYSRSSEYTMTPVNLVQLLKSQMDRMQVQIERAKVEVDFQADSNCPNVLGNARALEQVFNNLIGNALQAMSEKGGQLILRINKIDPLIKMNNEKWKSLKVSVIDNGPGIPKEIQERIFQPYFTTNQSGTGLGLPITKRIITAHRGTITLESFPGGTVFHVILPTCE